MDVLFLDGSFQFVDETFASFIGFFHVVPESDDGKIVLITATFVNYGGVIEIVVKNDILLVDFRNYLICLVEDIFIIITIHRRLIRIGIVLLGTAIHVFVRKSCSESGRCGDFDVGGGTRGAGVGNRSRWRAVMGRREGRDGAIIVSARGEDDAAHDGECCETSAAQGCGGWPRCCRVGPHFSTKSYQLYFVVAMLKSDVAVCLAVCPSISAPIEPLQ
mmetsp:Transcript_20882/g.44014  ORF Transcript_20882/g.44014 Transcript_20882/m.44014 type:complete len:218 (+) Transcript_20882:1020-1673(+)